MVIDFPSETFSLSTDSVTTGSAIDDDQTEAWIPRLLQMVILLSERYMVPTGSIFHHYPPFLDHLHLHDGHGRASDIEFIIDVEGNLR